MQTLSKGYKKPEVGDRGSEWFPALQDNIERVNGHKHDGSDGEKILSKDLTSTTSTIANTDWGSDSGGSTYSYTLTVPTGIVFENHSITVIDTDNGHQIFPTITKASSTTITLTVNDNTLNLKVIYG